MVPNKYPNMLFPPSGSATPMIFNGVYSKRIAVKVLLEKISLSINIISRHAPFIIANAIKVDIVLRLIAAAASLKKILTASKKNNIISLLKKLIKESERKAYA